MTIQHDVRPPLLRPRCLVTSLFADALEGDTAAEDHLRGLVPGDPLAEAALEAIVVAEIDARFAVVEGLRPSWQAR